MELNHRSFVRVQEMFGEMSNDNRILAVALNYHMEEEEKEARKAGRLSLSAKMCSSGLKRMCLVYAAQDYLIRSSRSHGIRYVYRLFDALCSSRQLLMNFIRIAS